MPWQAGVAFNTGEWKDKVFCGGTIICPRFVISAAHCQKKDGKLLDKSDVIILTGATRLPPEGDYKRHEIKEIHIHPESHVLKPPNTHLDFDLIIYELKRPIRFGISEKPVFLADPNDPIKIDGVNLVTSGWGYIDNEKNQADRLQALQLPFFPWEQCKAKYAASLDIVTENMVCAGGEGKKDACYADNGGEDHCTFCSFSNKRDYIFFRKPIITTLIIHHSIHRSSDLAG